MLKNIQKPLVFAACLTSFSLQCGSLPGLASSSGGRAALAGGTRGFVEELGSVSTRLFKWRAPFATDIKFRYQVFELRVILQDYIFLFLKSILKSGISNQED